MANRTTATGSITNRTSPVAHVLHPVNLQEQAKEWLREDTPAFDYGGFVVGEKEETAVLLCKSEGVLAGCPFFNAVFSEVGCEVTWLKPEGEILKPVCKVAHIHGKARQLLLAERVALNVLCRASGVATGARKLSNIAKGSGWHGEVAGTRKTTPGFRAVEKYALLVGGVSTHRMDLSSMIMLKDNHIWSAGNITQAVKSARRVGGFSIKLEVECRSVQEAHEATAAGADIVMLDNFDPMAIQKAARQVKDRFPQVLIEASGGISPANIIDYMGPHIDIVSLSCTTQGYDVVNFSMKILKEGHDPENPTVHFT